MSLIKFRAEEKQESLYKLAAIDEIKLKFVLKNQYR